jgi:hypothetical protein
MRWHIAESFCFRAKGCLLLCIVLSMTEPAHAQPDEADFQPESPVHLQIQHQHLFIAPAAATTPLSAQIQAEAAYVAAYGGMLESAAVARNINAQAVAMEIQNSVAYVDAYFKRRELNREWRAKENPNYLEREKRLQDTLKRRVEEQYQDVQRGDVTKTLNWLLRELANPVVAYRYLPANQTLRGSQIDRLLTRRDLEQIRLSDGGTKASRLVFTAADGKPLLLHWPLGLRGPEFDVPRTNYERSLEDVIRDIKTNGQASYANQTQVMTRVNELFLALEEAYPKERRQNPSDFLTYATAKRVLQSTLASTHRALTSNDAILLSGGLRFEGDTLIGLLEHMYKNGFEFTTPEPGGEGVYKNLFQSLRSLYVNIGPNRPAVDLQPMAAGAEAAPGQQPR